MSRVVGDRREIDRWIELSRRFDRSYLLPLIYFDVLTKQGRQDLAEYRDILSRLYMELAKRLKVDTVVDSSKIPTRAMILAGIPILNVEVLHLVRDPRAVAMAWRKKKFDPGSDAAMPTYKTIRSVFFWVIRQLLSELLGRRMRYVRLRYEDLVRAPKHEVERVIAEIPFLAGKTPAFVTDNVLMLSPLHSLSGNPDRFHHGQIGIKADLSWKAMPIAGWVRFACLIISPVSRRYGYPQRQE